MDLLQEYRLQQKWRNWQQYLAFIPIKPTDLVVDLGCSVGAVSQLLAKHAQRVVGLDINPDFIAFCDAHKSTNTMFYCAEFDELSSLVSEPINGIWSSFALSYHPQPSAYLSQLYQHMAPGGWIALLDVACFLSGNLPSSSKYYNTVYQFEKDAFLQGVYDFDFGSKLAELLTQAGFVICYKNDDVSDSELNFSGIASDDVLAGWQARLTRLPRLKALLGNAFNGFCQELLNELATENHQQGGNVRFIVAQKPISER